VSIEKTEYLKLSYICSSMDLIRKQLKHIVFIFILHFPFTVYSQVEMEKVLIEMGTATWSPTSAQEVEIINNMQEDGLAISIVNYHLNDDYSNQSGNQRASYYNIQSLPFPIVGGENVIAGSEYSYNLAYEESLNTLCSFSISSSGYFLEDTLFLDINIEKIFTYESDSISLYVTLTESDIPKIWYGQTTVDNVEMVMLPDGNGRDLDFTENSLIHIQEKILFHRNWNPENMELLVFLQNDTTKKILQCHAQDIINFAPLPVHAFFSASDTIICEGNTISFQNKSTGNIDNAHWTFQGGTPAESFDINPIVQYPSSGVYPVSLAVSNAVSTDTIIVQDFSHINQIPELSFEVFPEFCHDQTQYLLTEGYPSGGSYYGLFVDTGYFHPEAAGVGEHEIYYTYEDENTHCADTISEIAHVYLCDVIDEGFQQDIDFPYFIKKENQHIKLIQKANANIHVISIQVFDINGKQIYQEDIIPKDKKNHYFSVPLYNPLLLIRVLTAEREFIIKLHY